NSSESPPHDGVAIPTTKARNPKVAVLFMLDSWPQRVLFLTRGRLRPTTQPKFEERESVLSERHRARAARSFGSVRRLHSACSAAGIHRIGAAGSPASRHVGSASSGGIRG